MTPFKQSPDTLLSRFPKSRTALPEAYRKLYVAHYRMNREGASPTTAIAKRMESWMHRMVAADASNYEGNYKTLEIGAGGLNHLQYEPESKHYDIVEPFEELYAHSELRSRVSNFYRDLNQIEDEHYDRIVSIAAFEHLCDLPSVVAKCGMLLNCQGQLRIAIPSEGTLLWTLGWKLTTGIEFQIRYGLDYGLLMKHEHVNTSDEIFEVLRFFFRIVRRKVFGICAALSFYQFIECTQPDTKRCADYLQQRSH